MSGLLAFAELGFRHITDPGGMDHVLFLMVLAAIYRPRDVRAALAVVTAFTVGHSATLALAVTGWLPVPTRLVEFLIPVTIVATCAENLLVRDGGHAPWPRRYRPVLAGVFGLVHGAGFASYLRSLFVEDVALPLLGFNLGLEAGQVLVLLGAALLFAGADRALAHLPLPPRAPAPPRLRVVAVSCVVAVVAAVWAAERAPW